MRPLTFLLPFSCLLAGSAAVAQTPEVIYCKVATSPKSTVPGTLDLGGNPAPTQWRAIEDMSIRWDGGLWVVKGRTQLGSDLETVLVAGSNTTGIMFCQEGQPVAGGLSGELYDFFDSPEPASFNYANQIGFSFRARGGTTSVAEKLVVYDAPSLTHTVLVQQSDLIVGLLDTTVSGDETVGNSANSTSMLNSGELAFVNTPIGNCSTTRYPAMMVTVAGVPNKFRQSGVDIQPHANGADPIDTLGLSDSGMTPDGAHWYSEAEVENEPTATDKVLIVDDIAVLQEGFPVDGSSLNLRDIFQTRMAPNGVWISRGDYSNADDWVVVNGTRVLETGDMVGGETVTAVISGCAVNQLGDWVATCVTDGPDASNEVLVFNGTVIAREGDPIDLDDNGMFDDDCFIGRATNTLTAFNANDVFITDNLHVYFMCALNDGMGNDYQTVPSFGTPDAFCRIRLANPNGDNKAYCFGSNADCPCGNGGSGLGGCDNAQSTGGVVLGLTTFTPNGMGGGTATMHATGYPPAATPTAILIRSPQPQFPVVVFGDGLRCVSATGLVRLAANTATGGSSVHNLNHMAGAGTFHYQAWYRNNPQAFCDPAAGFNLSNAYRITW